MSANTEAFLNNALLRYICECQVSGDLASLRRLGVPGDVLELLRGMTVYDALYAANARGANYVRDLNLDWSVVRNTLQRAAEERRDRYTQEELVRAGAPLQLLQSLYGLTANEFSMLRQMQSVELRGRIRLPTPEQEQQVFDYCRAHKIDAAHPETLTGEDWLGIARGTGLPLRMIHKIVCGETDDDEEAHHEYAN